MADAPHAGGAWTIEVAPGYRVSDDPALLDVALVHRFLSEEAYWARGRTREVVERSCANSLCIGLYGPSGQAGFARVVTDRTMLAWLCDVFVLPEGRGRGLGKALVEAVLAHPELATVTRWVLRTADASGLYARYGFRSVTGEDETMVMTRTAAIAPQPPGR